MTERHLMPLRLLLMLADAVLAAVVFMIVSIVRFEADPDSVWSVGVDVGPAAVLFAVTWVAVLWIVGIYRLNVRWSLLAEARDIARGTIAMVAITLSLLFVFHQDNVSRVFLALLFVAQPLMMLAGRALLRRWFEAHRRRGRLAQYMIIAGTGQLAEQFADEVEAHPALGMKVIGHLAIPGSAEARSVSRPILGDLDDMSSIFRENVVDEVGVCLPVDATQYLDPIVTVAADEGKTVRVPRAPEEGVLSGALREDLGSFLVQSIVHDGHRDLQRVLKRVLDVAGAFFALVVLSPLLIAIVVSIRLRDGAPVLFRQTRIGLHGRPFTIYKFRTMVPDAEERFPEVAALSDTRGAAFKMERDPRVTRLGRVLRTWTFDELPQLFNVLRGDMSLVGPRPAPPREVKEYDIWHRRRLSVRPGMTGLWQVEARFDDHFDDRAELDLRYIDQWSLLLDIGILARTVPAVLASRGR